MKVRGLQGLRVPDNQAAAKVVSPPYDAVSLPEARALVESGACAFLRVVLPEAFLAEAARDDEQAQCAAAAAALDGLTAAGLLARAGARELFVYELEAGAGAGSGSARHVQRGLFALVSIDDYAAEVIRPHEHTRADKELQRAALAGALGAHTGPALLAHAADARVAGALAAVAGAGPPAVAVARGGVAHRLWACGTGASAELRALFADVPGAYIADGHHRAAAAARVGVEQRAAGGTQMPRESDWFPAVLFPAAELRSRPYYRAVADLGAHAGPRALLAALRAHGVPAEPLPHCPRADAARPGQVLMALRGDAPGEVAWFELAVPSKPAHDGDYQALQDAVLAPVLGVTDPRTDPRVSFVGGHPLRELHRMVEAGEAAVAFAPRAVQAEEMMAVVDSGRMMPPKSTWFEPKLGSGFFVHRF